MCNVLIADTVFKNISQQETIKNLAERYDVKQQVIWFDSRECHKQIVEISQILSQANRAVIVGGGALLDACKVASVNPINYVSKKISAGRSGLVVLKPDIDTQPCELIAVPTTFGTGSENNNKAVMKTEKRQRLVVGVPRYNSYHEESELYTSLSPRQRVYGFLEILMRIIALYIYEDMEINTRRKLLQKTLDLDSCFDPMIAGDKNSYERIADISRYTHSIEVTSGNGFVWPLWYLANEVSAYLNIVKMEATIPLISPVAAYVRGSGDKKSENLWNFESKIGMCVDEYVAYCCREYKSDALKMGSADIDVISRNAVTYWGGIGMPLYGVSRSEIVGMLEMVAAQSISYAILPNL